MDFGLAKRMITEEGKEEDLTSALTREGSTLGTPAYMSPEQIRAQPVDHRSDIFSFGIVLYEMLTGVHPFRKTTQNETIGAILHDDPPPLETYREDVPELIQHILNRMFDKSPERRYQDARQIRIDLEEALEAPNSQTRRAALSQRRRRGVYWAVAVFLILLGVAVPLYWLGLLGVGPSAQTGLDFSSPPRPLTALPGIEKDPAVSPDGNHVAFVWNGGGDGYFHLYSMQIGGGERLQLTHAKADDLSPVWSPGDSRIAFLRWSEGRLEIWWVPFPTGPEKLFHTLRGSDEASQPGLDWSPDGRFLAVEDQLPGGTRRAVYLLDVSSHEVTQVSFPPPGAVPGDSRAVFSPDGSEIAFLREYLGSVCDIYLQSISEGKAVGKARTLISRGANVEDLAWSPLGDEVFFTRLGILQRVPRTGGDSTAVAPAQGAVSLAIDRKRNRLIYSGVQEDFDIWRMPGPAAVSRTEPEPFIRSTRNEAHPRYSPDGMSIAFHSNRSGSTNIWLADFDGTNPRQLTYHRWAIIPRWAPRGDRLAFHSFFGDYAELFLLDLDRAEPTPVTGVKANQGVPVWSPDGSWIYFNRQRRSEEADAEWQIWRVRPNGEEPQRLTENGVFPFGVDEEFVYFLRPLGDPNFPLEAQVWKAPTEGGEASLVVDDGMLPTRCDLWEGKLVYINRHDRVALRVLDLATGQATTTAVLDARSFPIGIRAIFSETLWAGMSVSPDGKWVLYGRPASMEADLMVIDSSR